MELWEWINDFAEQAYENRDRERFALVGLCQEALPLIQTDPEAALSLMMQGSDLAAGLGEEWWTLFFDHWRLQALLFHMRDFTTALPLAIASVAEVCKPQYAEFPQRICLHEDLISAYQGIDPLGYASQTEEAIAYMTAQIPADCPCANCLQQIKTEYALTLGRLEDAQAAALDALRMAVPASDYLHAVIAYRSLCQIAYQQRAWDHLRQWAKAGAMFAGREVEESAISELLMWDAVGARQAGDLSQAQNRYLAARRHVRQLGGIPTNGFFDAWSAYFEIAGQDRIAVRVRKREMAFLEGKGQVYLECRCHLHLCRLKARTGQPWAEDAVALRTLAAGLRDATPLLRELAEVTGTPS